MKRFLLLLAALVVAGHANAAWKPPANPDPKAILHSALDDRLAKRYDDALAKHIWFRTKAQGPQVAVRNTFALGWFAELADVHPPARKALVKMRAEAHEKVRKGQDLEASFADMAAIDRELDDPLETAAAFMQLEKRSPDDARKVSRSAMDALVEARYYELAAKYVVPRRDLAEIADTYRRMASRPPPGSTDELAALNERFFATGAARLVALLSIAKRNDEAESLAATALEVSSSAQVREMLERAKAGQVPPPFISREDRQRMRAGLASPH